MDGQVRPIQPQPSTDNKQVDDSVATTSHKETEVIHMPPEKNHEFGKRFPLRPVKAG